jgi:hypothetical protein
MKKIVGPQTVRRSFVVRKQLMAGVIAAAPLELRHNTNRLVTVALQEFVTRREAQNFEDAMAQMASDPALRAESEAITQAFVAAEADGLRRD